LDFSVATWNINSVRLRIDLVLRYLAERRPDVLCLQETKCPDANFPHGAFRDAGYPHIAISGQKGYHGVAIVSRVPFAHFSVRDFCLRGDARHLRVVLDGPANGVQLHNFYVPAGGDEPDPKINPKFAHKLAFVDEMAEWAAADQAAAGRAILVGDLNIAPLEHDVWSHKALIKVVSHTPVEVEKLKRAQAAGPWVDAVISAVTTWPGGFGTVVVTGTKAMVISCPLVKRRFWGSPLVWVPFPFESKLGQLTTITTPVLPASGEPFGQTSPLLMADLPGYCSVEEVSSRPL